MKPIDTLPPPAIPLPLFAMALLYGGMTCIAGVLGSKQIALGPLAVEAGIVPFLLLVALSSTVTRLYGKDAGNRLVRFGFIPLATAIALTWLVIQLPTDAGMWEPAKEAFPIVLGQGARLMVAGIVAYGVSMTLNVVLFARLAGRSGRFGLVAGAVAAMVSQVVDTVIFITIGFLGQREIGALIVGQALAKVVLSLVLVPLLIGLFVTLARRSDPALRDRPAG